MWAETLRASTTFLTHLWPDQQQAQITSQTDLKLEMT